MRMPLGSDDYREGALERLEDAIILRDQQRWVAAIYLAGRAVEAILRSLLWLKSRQQGVGHDLRDCLKRARSLGLLREDEIQLQDHINDVAVIWYNNLRFVGSNRLLRDIKATGRDKRIGSRRVKGVALQANAKHMVAICESIIARGDQVWTRYRANLKNS